MTHLSKIIRSLLLASVICLCGCPTTGARSTAGADHRQDQANRLTERDTEPQKKKTRRPLDDRSQDRQNIIDQPRP